MGILDIFKPRKELTEAIKHLEDRIITIDHRITDASKEIKSTVIPELPTGRRSYPDFQEQYDLWLENLKTVKPGFIIDMIPVIRQLFKSNQNLGLAVFDMVQLTNTGHRVIFDPEVNPDQVDLMRKHLSFVSKKWGHGVAGINGLINKMIAQIYITGALSNEWVINNEITGIKNVHLIRPEFIRFSYRRNKAEYQPYQIIDKTLNSDFVLDGKQLRKLNPQTYKYFGLISDVDEPYGIPPFLTALEDIADQRAMRKNMAHIMSQVGLMGFLEVLLAKPDMQEGENEQAYSTRLTNLLKTTRENVKVGLDEALSVGYKEDHEYTFHSTTKNMSGVPDIFNINQRLVANGLKFSPSFLGVSNNAETSINIVFTKMLSQLRNTQEIIQANLEFAYALELVLAGFKFNYLKVSFNPSTITDALKEQQTEEIKIRNVNAKYKMGVIGQERVADELGYEKPDQDEPREMLDDPTDDPAKKREKREKDKDKSDRTSRDKDKSQPRRRDTDTRER